MNQSAESTDDPNLDSRIKSLDTIRRLISTT